MALAALLAPAAHAQHIGLYQQSWLFSVSGDLYFVGSKDKILYSVAQCSIWRESDRAHFTTVSGAWPLQHGVAVAQPDILTNDYTVRTFDGGSVLYTGQEIPFAVSRDGLTVLTSKDKVTVHLLRRGVSQSLHLPAHLLGATLSPDGSLGIITLQNGKSMALSTDAQGKPRLRQTPLRFASPIFGPDWHNDTVAVFGSETNRPDGLGSVWLYNARTGQAENLHTNTVAVTATRNGFLALGTSGTLDLLDDTGRPVVRYGLLPGLGGFRYDRGPIAYNSAVGLEKEALAGGAPTSLAFTSSLVIARDEFGRVKKAPAPWIKSSATFAKLVGG